MITNLINLLALGDFHNVSHRVDIAKGRYDIPYSWKAALKNIKTRWYGRKNNN